MLILLATYLLEVLFINLNHYKLKIEVKKKRRVNCTEVLNRLILYIIFIYKR